LFVKRVGQGSRVVLLHGGVVAGELCWSQQLPLADRFTLEMVDRAGYGRSRQVSPGEDLDADAPLVAGLLPDRAHLVGHSSGAVAAMLAAALRPEVVLSLTLCEPPAFQLAPAQPTRCKWHPTWRSTCTGRATTRTGCAASSQ
jgi:pimeloyl-ACP methyl ester carboxylesterase